jgi:hypothetical protein
LRLFSINISKPNVKAGLIFALVFAVTFFLSIMIIGITKIQLLSAIDLIVFSLLLSLLTATLVLLFVYNGVFVSIKLPYYSRYKLILSMFLLFMIVTLIFQYCQKSFGVVFQEWSTINPLTIIFSSFVFLAGLYVPAYVFHKTIIRSLKFELLEKAIFYPVISAIILGSLKILLASVNLIFIDEVIFLCFLTFGFIILFRGAIRDSKDNQSVEPKSFDLSKTLAIFSAIAFSLFLLYSAIGGERAFLRGDMWGEAQVVSSFSKYGLSAFSSPVAGYPPFYSIFWSALFAFLPIPSINGLIFTAFFNHIFSIMALFLLARYLFKDGRTAAMCVILWTVLSDFSWVGVFLNSPGNVLSGNGLLDYITNIFTRFGYYSGGRVSTIYADGHTLTRLWSLGLLFVSAAAIMKACSDKNRLKEGLFIFSIGVLQILIGHITEIPVLSVILFVSVLLLKPDSRFLKVSIIAMGALSAVNSLVTLLVYDWNYVYLIISISPFISLLLATALLKISKVLFPILGGKQLKVNLVGKTKLLLAITIIFLYGLMFIAFFLKGGYISYPIATIWYFPAIEWGFLGLVAVITLSWFLIGKISFSIGLKVALSILGSQLLLLLLLNFLNFNFFYIENPYPFEPILFLPFLALVGTQFFVALKIKMKFSKIKLIVFVFIFIVLFSFGSLDNVINTSYSTTNGGWWSSTNPERFSTPDYELMNFLYSRESTQPYDFIGSLEDWTSPAAYVVYPSGMTLLSPPLISILSQATDSREIYQLTHTFPIEYLLISKDQPLPPSRFLSFNGVNDSIVVKSSDSLKTMDSFTVEFWIVLHNSASDLQDIFSQRSISDKLLIRRLVDDRIVFYVWTDGKENSVTIPPLTKDTPYNLAITYDKTIGLVQIYENGILVATNQQYGSIKVDDMSISIGKSSSGSVYYFDGMLSTVQVYNRPLSAEEIGKMNLNENTSNTYEGALLQLPMTELSENTTRDISGNNNTALVVGASIKSSSSFIINALERIEPIFNNEKYKVYLFSDMNASKTSTLNTTGFLTFEKLAINGNITIKNELNSQIDYKNGEFTVYSDNDGKCMVNVWQNGTKTENLTVMTPNITVEGNMSFVKMKSSWTYFKEIKCMADNLIISGKVSFGVQNTFDTRVYAINFSYSGNYTAYPEPDSLRIDYIRTQIKEFQNENYISPWSVVTSPSGVIWTIIIVLLLVFCILRTQRFRFSIKFHKKIVERKTSSGIDKILI